MIWFGSANEPGAISSRREPTAEKASTARTPSDLSAAMFARAGTAEGGMECPLPWRVRKAICVPDGRAQMEMGALGKPQGCVYTKKMLGCVDGGREDMPYRYWIHILPECSRK